MATPGKRHIVIIWIILIIAFFGIGMGVQRSVMALDDFEEGLKKLRLLTQIMVLIQDEYVDPSKTNTEELVEGAIHGMMSRLDRYSVYMEVDEAKEFSDQTQGSFGGLGIQIDVGDDGWITVIEPLPDTPAAEAGLMSGDKIVEIEGESTKGMNIYEVVKELKGEPGTDVTLSIARRGEKELLEVPITRAIIKTKAVQNEENIMLDDKIAYIRLRDFTRDAAKELENAIEEKLDQGMKGLILDLRDNVGGLLDVAVEICDLFIEPGKVIVSHRNLHEGIDQDELVYRAEEDPIGDFLLVVLVNEFSASASEIVAGCIQDHRRGIIVGPSGHRTFGKGSVQTLIDLPALQGASIKLTTARYFTPSGRSIEEDNGLLPDVFAQVTDEERIKIRRADKVGFIPKRFLVDTSKKLDDQLFNQENETEITEDVEELPETSGKDVEDEISVDDVFDESDIESEEVIDDGIYDIELLTGYQCLRGASVLFN